MFSKSVFGEALWADILHGTMCGNWVYKIRPGGWFYRLHLRLHLLFPLLQHPRRPLMGLQRVPKKG